MTYKDIDGVELNIGDSVVFADRDFSPETSTKEGVIEAFDYDGCVKLQGGNSDWLSYRYRKVGKVNLESALFTSAAGSVKDLGDFTQFVEPQLSVDGLLRFLNEKSLGVNLSEAIELVDFLRENGVAFKGDDVE